LRKAGLIRNSNTKYRLASFGKVVYDAQLMIGKAVQSYWKLKALDSFGLSSSVDSQLAAEEYNKVIDVLMSGNDEIKDILRKYNNKNDIAEGQKEKVFKQQLIPSRLSYE
jgi:hypothetical protein